MTLSPPAHSRRVAFAAFVALLALLMGTAAAPASAKSKNTRCGKQVVDDWFGHADHKVHGHYPLHCYAEALDSLDPSVNDYTNARQAITAAAQAEALRCKTNCGPPGSGTAAVPTKLLRGEKWIEFRNTSERFLPPPPPNDGNQVSSNASSVPVPLLVLAGLAGILLLAGGASYVARRVKAGRAAPPASPPATDS